MKPGSAIPVAALLFGLEISTSSAAELGQNFDSYLDMHQQTGYGSLFLNKDSIRTSESRSRKRFVLVVGAGELSIPTQQGYCFVFNHYDSPSGRNNVPTKYRATIIKTYNDGQGDPERFSGNFTPTTDPVSANLPDLCVSSIDGATRISIEFSSDDGRYLNRKISFAVK